MFRPLVSFDAKIQEFCLCFLMVDATKKDPLCDSQHDANHDGLYTYLLR